MTPKTMAGLRSTIRDHLQQAASKSCKFWEGLNLDDPSFEQIRGLAEICVWERNVSGNLRWKISNDQLQQALVWDHEITNYSPSFIRRIAAYHETIYFIREITSANHPTVHKPKNMEELFHLAEGVFKAFYSVITNEDNGYLPATKIAAAQNSILIALIEIE